MSTRIDLKGLACPMPVIKTKKALEEISEGVIEVVVNNEAPKINILKFAKSVNCEAELIIDEPDEKVIRIVKGKDASIGSTKEEDYSCEFPSNSNEVVAIMSNRMGSGNDELGAVLIKGFLFALTESTPLPRAVLFLNGGVELTTINEATVEHIKRLEEAGVEILSCGTCLDYYSLKDELKVGSITNMYTIVETMKSATKVITIG